MLVVIWRTQMKRVAAILFLASLAGFLVYEFAIVKVCDGWLDVTVEIDAESAKDVSRVSYILINQSQMASTLGDSLDVELKLAHHQDSVEPFTVRVGTSCRESNLGRTWGYAQQYSHLIVVLQHADGSRIVHRLAIPSRDGSRRISVTAASAI